MATATKPRIHAAIEINAPRERIWSALTALEHFQDWGKAFMPGSYYEGEWKTGGVLRFLAPTEDGGTHGMACRILAIEPGHQVRAEHFAVIYNGQDVFEGPEYDEWIPCIEEYRIEGGPETFTLRIQNEVPEPYVPIFTESWNQALQRIKEIAEA